MNSEIYEKYSNQLNNKNIDELNVCRFCLANEPNQVLLSQDLEKYFYLFEKLTKIELNKYSNICKYICIECTEFLNNIEDKFIIYREINIFWNEFLNKQNCVPPSTILQDYNIKVENNVGDVDNDVKCYDFTKIEVNKKIDDNKIDNIDENSDYENKDDDNNDADYDSDNSLKPISQILIEDFNNSSEKEIRNQFKCERCHRRHGSNQALVRHIRRNHNPNYERENQFICHYCDCNFDNKSTLINHLDVIHRGCALNEMRCNICEVSFLRFYQFNLHNQKNHMNLKSKLTTTTIKGNHDIVGDDDDDDDDYDDNNKSQKMLDYHRKMFKEKTMKCIICNILFNKKSLLDSHMKGVHATTGPMLICEICGSHFKVRQSLNKHIKAIHSDDIDPNEDENDLRIKRIKYQERNERLKQRREKAKEQPKQQCPFCPSQFVFIETFRVHMKKKHGTAGKAEYTRLASYCCQTCNLMFETKEARSEHRQNVHPAPTPKLFFKHFQCSVCKRFFSTKDILERHEANHSKKPRPFKCSECELTFTSKSYMDVHYRCVHTDERPFACQECDRRCPTLHQLNAHIRFVHRKEKRHGCSMCDQKFHKQFQLKKHEIRSHTKEYPYTCPIEKCGRKFTLGCGYAAHMQRIHNQLPP